MLTFILLICVFELFIFSAALLIMDLTSTKRNTNRPTDEKLPELGKYSFIFNLFALFLLVIVSFLNV
jgi:hypothetical protein